MTFRILPNLALASFREEAAAAMLSPTPAVRTSYGLDSALPRGKEERFPSGNESQ